MKSPSAGKKRKNPLFLTARDEKILRTIYAYRYMTRLDVAWLLFRPTSKNHVGEILTRLSGGNDLQTHTYLCRFGFPSVGNAERVFTLGAKGRSFLAGEGWPITWYFRPNKIKHLSHAHIQHNLLITRFVVAAHVWARRQTEFNLVKVRFGHGLTNAPKRVRHSVNDESKTVPVIPDAWLLFERVNNGNQIPILLEIDRGMEYQKRFKEHIRSRLRFIAAGEYEKVFGVQSVRIAYATTGEVREYRERRVLSMRAWTMDVLTELGMKDWAQNFYFASMDFASLYDLSLFEKPVWLTAVSASPVRLLPSQVPNRSRGRPTPADLHSS